MTERTAEDFTLTALARHLSCRCAGQRLFGAPCHNASQCVTTVSVVSAITRKASTHHHLRGAEGRRWMAKEILMIALNEGVIDRTIRIVIGALLVLLALTTRGTGWAYLGMIPLVTGTIGFCPLYALLRVSTYEECEATS
jgi:hypothetical protein